MQFSSLTFREGVRGQRRPSGQCHVDWWSQRPRKPRVRPPCPSSQQPGVKLYCLHTQVLRRETEGLAPPQRPVSQDIWSCPLTTRSQGPHVTQGRLSSSEGYSQSWFCESNNLEASDPRELGSMDVWDQTQLLTPVSPK